MRDDGTVYRHQRDSSSWITEMIYAGPRGMRGVAVGSFEAAASIETLAVFGYSKRVELSTRDRSG